MAGLEDFVKDKLSFLFQDAGDQIFRIEGTNLSILTVDVVDNESHSWDNDVTTYEVEGLEDISDNIKPKPDEITVSCFISNTPVSGLIDEVTHFADRFLNGRQRTRDAFNQLLALRRLRIPVTVTTRYRVYNNAAITGINITRKPEDGESISFDVRFRVIGIVKTQTTKVPPGLGKQDDPATQKRAGVKQDAGKSNGKTITPANAPKQVKVSGLAAAAGKTGANKFNPANLLKTGG